MVLAPLRPASRARRSVDIWTVRLLSSTAALGHTASMISFLVTSSPGRDRNKTRSSVARDPSEIGVTAHVASTRSNSRPGTLNRKWSNTRDRDASAMNRAFCKTEAQRHPWRPARHQKIATPENTPPDGLFAPAVAETTPFRGFYQRFGTFRGFAANAGSGCPHQRT